MDWLKSIAPTIATAMGGPLAGMALEAVSKAIGVDPSEVQNTINSGKMTAEQIASIQTAEIALKARAQEMGHKIGVKYGEGFQSQKTLQVKNLFD